MQVLLVGLALICADPVPGDVFYLPEIGELGILHEYNAATDETSPTLEAWLDAASYAKRWAQMRDPKRRADLERALKAGGKDAVSEVVRRQIKEVADEPRRKGELIEVADGTRIKILAFARFIDFRFGDAGRISDLPDTAFVEILDGPTAGKTAWVSRFSVRVPGKKMDFGGLPSKFKLPSVSRS